MRRKTKSRRVIYVLLALIAVYLGACAVLARNYVQPVRRVPVRPEDLREIEVATRFGPTPSWAPVAFGEKPNPRPIFLLAHGYGGARDSWTDLMRALESRGFDSVALSMPGQDQSPVRKVGFGLTEAQVIVDGVDWLRKKYPGRKVIVLGMSMGGGAAWIATEQDPSIDGVITDSAFANFVEPMNAFFDSKIPGGSVILWPVIPFAKAMTGIDPNRIVPLEAAQKWRGKPALVIQGDDDRLVAPSHGVRLSQAAACPLWAVPHCTHVEAFTVDPEEYLRLLTAFANDLGRAVRTPKPEKTSPSR